MKISELLASNDIETVRLGLNLVEDEFLKWITFQPIDTYTINSITDIIISCDFVIFSTSYVTLENGIFDNSPKKCLRVVDWHFDPFISSSIPQVTFVKLYEQFENSRTSKFYRCRKFLLRIKIYFRNRIFQLG